MILIMANSRVYIWLYLFVGMSCRMRKREAGRDDDDDVAYRNEEKTRGDRFKWL